MAMPQAEPTNRVAAPWGPWGPFVVWMVIGFAAAVAVLVFGVPGMVALVLALVWVRSAKPSLLRSAPGAVSGIGVTLLLVAYANRRGLGTACWQRVDEAGCDQFANPWPWLVTGAVFVLIGVIANVRRLRRLSMDRRLPGGSERA
jgi:hypothetical protein